MCLEIVCGIPSGAYPCHRYLVTDGTLGFLHLWSSCSVQPSSWPWRSRGSSGRLTPEQASRKISTLSQVQIAIGSVDRRSTGSS